MLPNTDSPEQLFADALLTLASRAEKVGLNDYAELLDALYSGAVTRLGLDEAVPYSVVQ